MISFQLKKKNLLKYLDKQLEKAEASVTTNPLGEIQKIAILVEESQLLKYRFVDELAQVFKVPNVSIEMLVFKPYQKKVDYQDYECTEKDFGWSGSLKLNRLNEFVKNDYDLLINYGFEENLYWKIITLRSQSKFKIGFSSDDNRLYDLSVSDEKRNVNVLNSEAEKYLKILKKL